MCMAFRIVLCAVAFKCVLAIFQQEPLIPKTFLSIEAERLFDRKLAKEPFSLTATKLFVHT